MEKKENFKDELETQYNILIKANEEKEQQRYMIIFIIIIITLLFSFISMFFAFKAYRSTKSINDENQVITKVYNQVLSTTFNNGETLSLLQISNGYTLATPKIITITNEGDSDIIFDIKLTSIKTTMVSTNNLVYTLTKDNEVSDTMELPLNDKIITQNITITPNQTMTFILNAKYNGVIENGLSYEYSANISIEQKNNKTNLLE